MEPVFRILDIVVWIRIRIWIRGTMPLTNVSGSVIRILLFSSLSFKMPQKTNLKKGFLLIEGSGSGLRAGSGSIILTYESGSGSGGPKHVDPVDPNPDPEHWMEQCLSLVVQGVSWARKTRRRGGSQAPPPATPVWSALSNDPGMLFHLCVGTPALLPDGRILGRRTQKWPSKNSCGLESGPIPNFIIAA
jgi:hypothetical protein